VAYSSFLSKNMKEFSQKLTRTLKVVSSRVQRVEWVGKGMREGYL
jgi:hypothetical protein